MAFQTDDISINTIVGAGSFVRGNFFSEGFTRVDGDIDGQLEVSGRVIIGANARIRGDLIALSATVCGAVEGDILAPKSVHVLPKAVVLGDIVTQNLQIDDDVLVNGRCISLKDEPAFQEAKKRWLDEKAIGGKTFQTHSAG